MSGTRRKPGRLGSYVNGYRAWLLELGYAPASVTRSLGAMGQVGRWMDRHDIDAEQLNDDVLSLFVTDHVDRHGQLPSAGVMPLLGYLRSAGVAAPETARERSPLDGFLGEYRDWLAVERALASDTVRGYTRLARRFLAERVSDEDELGVQGLTGGEVTGFLLRESTRLRAGSVRCHANQLRQLLRYLAMRGFADPGLAEAVPRSRAGATDDLPSSRHDRRSTGSSRPATRAPGGRARLRGPASARASGLRAVEVSRLRLDDFDWRAGEIVVDGKAHRRDRLPLASDVGEAIVEHLRHRGRRPGERRVFLTVHAPIRPLEPSGVRTIVRNACRRAGIERVPAHRLRHALASDLLREGASMIDIGQVLRHKHLESTAIYAKVDLQRLRLAASPWPGAVR